MAVDSACPECDTSFPVTPALKGKKVRCKKCGHVFVVSGYSKRAQEDDEDEREEREERLATRRSPAKKAVPARRRREEDDEDEDDRPRRKSKGGLNTGVLAAIIGGGVLLLLGGGLGLAFALGAFSPAANSNNPVNPGPIAQNPNPNPIVQPNPNPINRPNPNPGPRPNPNPGPQPNPNPMPNPTRGRPELLQPATTKIALTCTDLEARRVLFARSEKIVGVYHQTSLDGKDTFDLYNWETSRHLGKTALPPCKPGSRYTPALSPDGKKLLLVDYGYSEKRQVSILAVPGGKEPLHTWDPTADRPPMVAAADMTPVAFEFLDDNTVAGLSQKGHYTVWTLEPFKKLGTSLVIPRNVLLMRGVSIASYGSGSFAFNSDRTRLAIFNGAGFNIIDTKTGQIVMATPRYQSPLHIITRLSVAFSPDGKQLVTVLGPNPNQNRPEEMGKDFIVTWELSGGGQETSQPTLMLVTHDAKLIGRIANNSGGNLDGSFRVDAIDRWGNRVLVLHNSSSQYAHLIDLDRKEYVQSLFTNYTAGQLVAPSPDGRLWYVNADGPGGLSTLAAVGPPVDAVLTPKPKNPEASIGWYFVSPAGIEADYRK